MAFYRQIFSSFILCFLFIFAFLLSIDNTERVFELPYVLFASLAFELVVAVLTLGVLVGYGFPFKDERKVSEPITKCEVNRTR